MHRCYRICHFKCTTLGPLRFRVLLPLSNCLFTNSSLRIWPLEPNTFLSSQILICIWWKKIKQSKTFKNNSENFVVIEKMNTNRIKILITFHPTRLWVCRVRCIKRVQGGEKEAWKRTSTAAQRFESIWNRWNI